MAIKIKNKRLAILSVTAVLAMIWYFICINPYSSTGINNICEDNEAALEVYSTEKDMKKLENYAQKRVDNCKHLLKKHSKEKNLYKKMENCDIFASAASASGFLVNIAVQNKNYSKAKLEIENSKKYMAPYQYCPQYEGIQLLFDNIKTYQKL